MKENETMSTTLTAVAPSNKVITFAVDEATEQTLEKLKVALGKTSRAEVLRKAIALLEVATEAEDEGGSLATLDEDGNVRHRIKLI
jgi:preprotein translocase subunit YajC